MKQLYFSLFLILIVFAPRVYSGNSTGVPASCKYVINFPNPQGEGNIQVQCNKPKLTWNNRYNPVPPLTTVDTPGTPCDTVSFTGGGKTYTVPCDNAPMKPKE
jgi:hypothetical protein